MSTVITIRTPPACGHGQRGLAPRLYLGVEAHGHAVHHVGQEEDGGLVPRDHWTQVLLSSYAGILNILELSTNHRVVSHFHSFPTILIDSFDCESTSRRAL